MKKMIAIVFMLLVFTVSIFAADAPKASAPKTASIPETAVPTKTAAAPVPTEVLTAVPTIVPTLMVSPSPVVTVAAAAVSPVASPTAAVEGMTPPAPGGLEGTYEEPNEPAPSAEETPEAVEKTTYRKDKHFTIEQTLYTPSAFGTRIGYFINENWRVMGEFSTISELLANANKERNVSWAISGNYSPADDDISPFFGAGISSIDIAYNSSNNGDSLKEYKNFLGGVFYAGVNWISNSPIFLSLEFDMYAGKFDRKEDNLTTPANSKTSSVWTLSVMLGGGVGLVF